MSYYCYLHGWASHDGPCPSCKESQAAPDRPRDCGPTSDRSVARKASEIDTVRWTAGASGITLGELWRGEFERLTARIAELEGMLIDHVKALECSRDLLIRALPWLDKRTILCSEEERERWEAVLNDIRAALGK